MNKEPEKKCCYNCESYNDALCGISDNYDTEDPNLFHCDMWEWDGEEM